MLSENVPSVGAGVFCSEMLNESHFREAQRTMSNGRKFGFLNFFASKVDYNQCGVVREMCSMITSRDKALDSGQPVTGIGMTCNTHMASAYLPTKITH